MITSILSVLCALLILTLFITVHEFGHFLVGRLFHFKINEFAIGMGPKIIKYQGKNVLFSLRAFPIGGMCVFHGEDDEIKGEDSFRSHKVWERILVVLAGPVFNLILAVLLSAISLMTYGKYIPKVISVDSDDCPAYRYNLMPNDIVTKVNGKDIIYFNQFPEAVEKSNGQINITVLRDGNEKDITIGDIFNKETGKNYLGIRIEAENLKVPFPKCIVQSFHYIYIIGTETFKSLSNLFKGNIKEAGLTGPVGTVAYVSEAVQYGMESIISFSILISSSLAIMNLLPIPAVDGGRLLFMLIEAVTGKPVDPQKEGLIHFIGIILLLILIIFISVNDFTQIFNGEMFK